MSENKKTTIKISMFMHKDDVLSFEQCIKQNILDFVEVYDVKREIGIPGKIYIHKTSSKQPEWKGELQELTKKDIILEDNKSNKAVVIFEYKKRFFSVVYGYGKSMLDDKSIVRNFGLKVAANLVDPEKLRSLNSMTIEDTILDTQKQAAEYMNQDQFRTDKNREILKSISGSPTSETIAKFLVGTDSLSFSRKMSIREIRESIQYFYREYYKEDYKNKGFEWIDNLQKEKDKEIIDSLDEKLTNGIMEHSSEIRIVPNKIINWDEINSFFLTGMNAKKEEATIEISYSEYFSFIRKRKPKNIIEKLKRDDLYADTLNGEVKISNIYEAIIYETTYDNNKYLLCYGDWFEVDKDFYKKIKERIKKVNKCSIAFPTCKADESEEKYNENFAKSNKSEYILIDQKFYQPPEFGRSKVEACDILTRKKQLIHVKKGGSSARFSHLFAQVLVSATLLSMDVEFKKYYNEFCRSAWKEDILLVEDTNTDYELVFAIIDYREKNIEDVIPFF